MEELSRFIESLRGKKSIYNFDEDLTKQAIVLKILDILGWDQNEPEEVSQEHRITGGKVDYALTVNKKNLLFIEAKSINAPLDSHEEQLLYYSFDKGVELALLTNGLEWWFYLPLKTGDWQKRRFLKLHLINDRLDCVQENLLKLLKKQNIVSGSANSYAEELYDAFAKAETIRENLPEVWNQIISEPDGLLVELIIEELEKKIGFKAENSIIIEFLQKINRIPNEHPHLGPPPIGGSLEEERKKIKRVKQPTEIRISRNDLLREIIDVLKRQDGEAPKKTIEEIIYENHRDKFNDDYFKKILPCGVIRWKHFIAWEKQRATIMGLIKRKEESGRGIWKLTQKGWNYK